MIPFVLPTSGAAPTVASKGELETSVNGSLDSLLADLNTAFSNLEATRDSLLAALGKQLNSEISSSEKSLLDDIEASEKRLAASIAAITTANVTGFAYAADVAAGLAATTDGQGFTVSGDNFLKVYVNEGGEATLLTEISPPEVTPEQFGFVVGDRTAAAANTVALQDAADFARANKRALRLWSGSGFILPNAVNLSGIRVLGNGVGLVQHIPFFVSGTVQEPCNTQIVLTGTSTNTVKVHGVSSMQACGAKRDFAPRTDLDESEWRMISFMEPDATTGVATCSDLAVGILIDKSGAHFEQFRVVVDGGGAHGFDEYNTATTSALIGGVDVGILHVGGGEVSLTDVQTYGHYRKAGYANVAISLSNDYSDWEAPYGTTLTRCNLQGMRGFVVRGPDKFAILDSTANTVDLPWASDHPFTLDAGHNTLRLVELGVGTARGPGFTYTSVSRVDVGGDDRIRLSGLIGFDQGSYGAVTPAEAGGANSHIVFRDCQVGGLVIPSGYQANDTAVTDPISNGAIGGFEISGWRSAEVDFHGRIQHVGSLAGFIHDTRETILDVMVEAVVNRRYARAMTWIVSPQFNENTHADNPVGGARWIEWRYNMISERTAGEVDYAPFMPHIPRPATFLSTNGWFESYWATRSAQIRTRDDQSTGQVSKLVAPALAVGPNAEGFLGFNADGLIHANTDNSFADVRIETSATDRDPRIFLTSLTHEWMISLNESSGGDFVLSSDFQKTGTFTERLRYENGAVGTGWNFSAPVTISLASLPTFADDAAASSLSAGRLYKTATGDLKVKL